MSSKNFEQESKAMEGGMTFEHTLGPWKVGRDEFPNEDQIYGPDRIIVGSAHSSRKEVKANARLIAQAPTLLTENQELKAINVELLEACREAYRFMLVLHEITQPVGMGQMTGMLGEAIARAEE